MTCTPQQDQFIDGAIDLVKHKPRSRSKTSRAVRWLGTQLFLCVVIFLLVLVILMENVGDWIDQTDFRSFDLRATAVVKYLLIFCAIYLLLIVGSAWWNGALHQVIR